MEPTGHYWFNLGRFLQDNEMKPVLVNPHHVREGRYMIPYLPDGVYADLRTASNIRFQLQAELTRIQKQDQSLVQYIFFLNIRRYMESRMPRAEYSSLKQHHSLKIS